MSTARIDQLLRESIPVPRKQIKGINENPLSKRLRRFDNLEIVLPFPNQSGVYINTNEHGVTQIFTKLATIPGVPDSIHIGFSGWHNFDIMAQRKSSRALICDINPENAIFLHYTLKYLRKFQNRDQFIENDDCFC